MGVCQGCKPESKNQGTTGVVVRVLNRRRLRAAGYAERNRFQIKLFKVVHPDGHGYIYKAIKVRLIASKSWLAIFEALTLLCTIRNTLFIGREQHSAKDNFVPSLNNLATPTYSLLCWFSLFFFFASHLEMQNFLGFLNGRKQNFLFPVFIEKMQILENMEAFYYSTHLFSQI